MVLKGLVKLSAYGQALVSDSYISNLVVVGLIAQIEWNPPQFSNSMLWIVISLT